MSDTREFTVQNGLDYQAADLGFWEGLLKPEIYQRLLGAVNEATRAKELKTGYDVPRGGDLDNWIKNIHHDYNPLHK